MDLIRDIAAVVGCISSVLALLSIFSERVQSFIKRIFTKHTKEIVETDAKQNQEINEVKSILLEFIKSQKNYHEEVNNQLNVIIESSKDMMRQRIMSYYYKGKPNHELTIYQKEAVDELYKDYKKLKGNSYIDKYYERMNNWKINYEDNEFEGK